MLDARITRGAGEVERSRLARMGPRKPAQNPETCVPVRVLVKSSRHSHGLRSYSYLLVVMLVQLFESPLGITRCLRKRLRWLLPLVALTVGLYSYDGRPTSSEHTNIAGALRVTGLCVPGLLVFAWLLCLFAP